MKAMPGTINPWVEKANRLIAIASLDAYRKANPHPRKKHRPYTIPVIADDLVRCVKTDNELEAKRIFLSYEGIELLSAGEH